MVKNLALGLILGGALGVIGQRTRFLTWSGVLALTLMSALVFAANGWTWGAPLLLVVASENIWARYRASRKEPLGDRFRQGARRGWPALFARIGWASVLALLYALAAPTKGIHIAFIGALATAAADSWATELGVLSAQPPRSLLTWRRVKAGHEGAISVLGLVAALGASWLTGFAGLLCQAIASWLQRSLVERAFLWLPLAALLGGTAGCLLDSFLGATAQGIYYCEHCNERSESRLHSCGREAEQIRGWAWLTNDGINFVSSVVGAAVAVGAVAWLAQTSLRW